VAATMLSGGRRGVGRCMGNGWFAILEIVCCMLFETFLGTNSELRYFWIPVRCCIGVQGYPCDGLSFTSYYRFSQIPIQFCNNRECAVDLLH
jgi:hypothetical protein